MINSINALKRDADGNDQSFGFKGIGLAFLFSIPLWFLIIIAASLLF
jgi:hypothetical protein